MISNGHPFGKKGSSSHPRVLFFDRPSLNTEDLLGETHLLFEAKKNGSETPIQKAVLRKPKILKSAWLLWKNSRKTETEPGVLLFGVPSPCFLKSFLGARLVPTAVDGLASWKGTKKTPFLLIPRDPPTEGVLGMFFSLFFLNEVVTW